MSDRNESSSKRKKSAWPVILGLPLIAVVAAAAILFTAQNPERSAEAPPAKNAPSSDTPSESAENLSEEEPERASGGGSAEEHPALGDADAPVVMLEFSDYQ